MEEKLCPFCNREEVVRDNWNFYWTYDKYPVSKGHLLIIPNNHAERFEDLPIDDLNRIGLEIDDAMAYLSREYNPAGFNVGFNNGEHAGQSVPHFHIHVIPRYKGDIDNPVGGVRGVIPERRIYEKDNR